MDDPVSTAFQDVESTFNTLQTNKSYRMQVCHEGSHPGLLLQAMRGFVQRAGLKVEDLDHLNIIHVTGTKGKGSTCAFTEQILRSHGYRTGFYSSPHLVQMRERIRINGQPISKELFTKYFWQVYSRLDKTKHAHGGTMPSHFHFLTVLAFHVFLQEKVNLAVIEVGIGGEYDCTNIIRNPWVCGIASLGIDHVSILGNTIEQITWHKGGIFKARVPAFTVRQPEGAITVLQERAKEIGCPLWVCPELEGYEVDGEPLRLGIAGQHQRTNASLALQLSHCWLQRRCQPAGFSSVSLALDFRPSSVMTQALADTMWLGRTQTVRRGPITYFLDGAHTLRSMLACLAWFREAAAHHDRAAGDPTVRVLMFNATGERDHAAMLKLLVPCQFDFAVFCPNIPESIVACNADQQDVKGPEENTLPHCLENQQSWRVLTGQVEGEGGKGEQLIPGSLPLLAGGRRSAALVFPCILSALRWISQGRDAAFASVDPSNASVLTAKAAPLRDAAEICVLITGSLHLVGGALKHLDPTLAA